MFNEENFIQDCNTGKANSRDVWEVASLIIIFSNLTIYTRVTHINRKTWWGLSTQFKQP